ncbi:Caspase domain-containing protein [Paenibacillus polysaccharolyticus]|uniref:Caspase domain-containing protein n=1 Tax=Paenibacillus polysaccharolyticus TaxID=582692 RepID=A0A1G5KHL7_9BACL|nr:caspase family protein [Paenibacillus polysaccharolyticus]SCZ00067.1 Caspase domain-containing protein [Paenibacillus polysaccharolyticus]
MKRALIVGINDYSNSPLYGCVNDANKIEKVLARNQDGSPNFECKKLIAQPHNITRSVLKQHVTELFSSEADTALFYFSGHGFLNNLGGFLVTQDHDKYDEGVQMENILSLANESKVREVIIILDCCHSGALGEVGMIKTDHAVLREGVTVLTASRAAQVSMEINGTGVFTSLICDALEGGAADVIGNVTIPSIYAYVDQALGAWDQRPLIKSHVSRLYPLRKCNPVIPLSILRLLPNYFPFPEFEFQLDPSFEPTEEPKNEENEEILSHLQKFRAARLVTPIGEEHMYFAAINSKSCKLTPLGQFYRKLSVDGKI